jgi:hypothetical protein
MAEKRKILEVKNLKNQLELLLVTMYGIHSI